MAQVDVRVAAPAADQEFSRLFHEYKRRAFGFAYQLTGNVEDAMDLTQEAFLRVHRNWRRMDPSRPFGPWLFSIVRNLAVDLARSSKSRQAREETVGTTAPAVRSPEALARQQQLRERVWEAIGKLPPEQREVLVLRDLQGFSYKEIAEITGAPLTTVNSRLHDARTALRELLGRYL